MISADQENTTTTTETTTVASTTSYKPKVPKGTRDMHPRQMTIRNHAMSIIKNEFSKHGAVEIDTPVFELKETLTGKYGEDSKLIYDLQDQGGELLSLRYDLTVPFARYLAMNNIQNMKRFHIAKVYRRDQPALTKGRYREFYQCDFDIAGSYGGSMIPDAESLCVLSDILSRLQIGEFEVKINHRQLLDAIIELSGSPKEKFKQICSSIDKLDKEPWTKVRDELIQGRGLTEKMADKIGEFVKLKDHPLTLLQKLTDEEIFKGNKLGEESLEQMKILFEYMKVFGCLKHFVFDLSLARGLDYYTGIIFEAVLIGANVGSIAGGGRYDNLVGMFSGKNIPAVGFSVGIERIFAILEEKSKDDPNIRCSQTDVLVASIGKGVALDRLKLCATLWSAQINAETLYEEVLKPQKQLSYAFDNSIPFIIFIGEDEVKQKNVKLRTLYTKEEITVDNDLIISTMKEKIAQYKKDLEGGKVITLQKETTNLEKNGH